MNDRNGVQGVGLVSEVVPVGAETGTVVGTTQFTQVQEERWQIEWLKAWQVRRCH